jgi:CO dehydrogenase/acetyl-CoA synthase epsilon subunit
MNKTYRIIWNKARNCLMVVGENAKSQAKVPAIKKP